MYSPNANFSSLTWLKVVKLGGKKTPNLATLPQRKSMRPTENEADMELKLWLWKKYKGNQNMIFCIVSRSADHMRPEPLGLIRCTTRNGL